MADVRKWVHEEASKARPSIRLCNELIKLDVKLFKHADDFEGRATAALKAHAEMHKNSTENFTPKLRAWDAVALHKTLSKTAGFADASFRHAAHEQFPYATYFK